jgi:hypothetical protein
VCSLKDKKNTWPHLAEGKVDSMEKDEQRRTFFVAVVVYLAQTPPPHTFLPANRDLPATHIKRKTRRERREVAIIVGLAITWGGRGFDSFHSFLVPRSIDLKRGFKEIKGGRSKMLFDKTLCT